jgi:hypothetical protein
MLHFPTPARWSRPNQETQEKGRNTVGDVSRAVRDVSCISCCCRKAVGDTSMHGVLPPVLVRSPPVLLHCLSAGPGRAVRRNIGRAAPTAVRDVTSVAAKHRESCSNSRGGGRVLYKVASCISFVRVCVYNVYIHYIYIYLYKAAGSTTYLNFHIDSEEY